MSNLFRRLTTAVLWSSLSALSFTAAAADEFPSKPVRFMIPIPAGGQAEVSTRRVIDRMRERTGWTVVVENRAGADYAPGILATTQAQADGHTVLFGFMSFDIVPLIRKELSWKLSDLTPVMRFSSSPAMVAINSEVPAKNWAELLAYSKANPGKLSFGGPPLGASGHLTTELLRLLTGLNFTYIPYRDANGPNLDLIAGRVHVGYTAVPDYVEPIKAGKLRGIMVMMDHRSQVLPDVPTAQEVTGNTELNISSWFGFFVKAGTPPTILARLERELIAAADSKDIREYMLKIGQEPLAVMEGSDAFRRRIEADQRLWERVIREAKIPQQ